MYPLNGTSPLVGRILSRTRFHLQAGFMEWPQVLMWLEGTIFNVQGFQLSVYLPCMTQGRLVQNVFRNPPADNVIISEALTSKLYPSFILNQFNPRSEERRVG